MDIELEIARARRLHKTGKADQAEAIYNLILAAEPAHGEALNLSGLAAMQRGGLATAITRLEAAVAASPGTAKYLSNLGAAYLADQRPADAIASFRHASEADPGFDNAWFNLGNAYMQTKQTDQAEDAFNQCLILMPEHIGALSNLAALLHLAGRSQDALPHARLAHELRPNDQRFQINLASLLFSLERRADAEELLEALLSSQPDYAPAQALKQKMQKQPTVN